MTLPRKIIESELGLSSWCILSGYRGSIAHGTYEQNSKPGSIDDKDVIAVCVPSLEFYFGLRQYGSRGTKEIAIDPWDIVIYEARKLIHLLAKGNPNVLMLLWLPENLYLRVEPAGQLLIDNRQLFTARSTFYPFMGYARSQLIKMERGAFKGYMGEKRRRLVERHGYDTKNASHLIRILRTGIEFLIDGRMNVQRHDAPELLAIKHGEWSLERVKLEADRLFVLAEEAHLRSPLPAEPDRSTINELAIEVVKTAVHQPKEEQ